jgi:hypothetical protein
MFRERSTYWMPAIALELIPINEVSLIFDNLPKLRDRVDRLFRDWRMRKVRPRKRTGNFECPSLKTLR